MIQKERDRERGDTDMLFCNDILCIVNQKKIRLLRCMHTQIFIYSIQPPIIGAAWDHFHVHRPWVLSSEGNNCNHDFFILAKPHSNPDTVPYAAT